MPSGHYQFVVMSYWHLNSLITFTRLMQHIFTHLAGKEFVVYMGDITVMSPDIPSHLTRLRHVLEVLKSANLKIKITEFLKTAITHPGHTASVDGIAPNADKAEAIKNYPKSTSVREVQSFLGLVGFYRFFMLNFSYIATPLTKLTQQQYGFE